MEGILTSNSLCASIARDTSDSKVLALIDFISAVKEAHLYSLEFVVSVASHED